METTQLVLNQFNPLLGTGNYSATSNNEVGTLAVDGWAVTFGTVRRGLAGAAARQASPHCTNGQCTNQRIAV